MKVAVIDDEADIRKIIRDYLVLDGYEVVEAENGVTGFEVIKSEVPDLIICDVQMPEMNGDELFNKIRQSGPELSLIPFIFLSGEATRQDVISRLNLGADNCLEKPIDFKLLLAHVKAQSAVIKRVSVFFKSQLDAIVNALQESVEYDFNAYSSLFSNVNGYVESIISLLKHLDGTDGETLRKLETMKQWSEGDTFSRLEYVDFFLDEYKKRRLLVRTTNGEDLSWLLIYLVVKAQIEGNKIPVSDLYVSAQSAKTTTYARINSLIEEGVFQKLNDSTDGRRQLMSLTDCFKDTLFNHIDSNIRMIKQRQSMSEFQ